MTRYTHPDVNKVVTVTNKATITVLEANGWVADSEKPARKPRQTKTDE